MTNLKLLRSLSVAGALLCLALHPTFANADGIFEGGVIPNVNGDVGQGFSTVNFQQSYSSAPVVFLLTTNVGGDPAAIRINNVTTSGFDAVIAEPPGPGAGHSDMAGVSYIAVLPGRYELPNGSILEAGRHSTNTTVWKGAGGHDTVNFSSAFLSSPVVLADIQTLVNETAAIPDANSVPWLTTSIDNAGSGTPSITTTGFDVALEKAETGTGNVAQNETIGYLAITSGHGTISSSVGPNAGFNIDTGTVEFDAGISADAIQGWTQEDAGGDGGGNAVSFTAAFAAVPEVVVASMATRDGADGGWLRANLGTISATGLRLAVDEDTTSDGERGHTPERASIVAFGNAFAAASAANQDVHFDDGTIDVSSPVDGSVGDNFWSNNINWRVNSNAGQQNIAPNNVAPGVTDRVNIAGNDTEAIDQPAQINSGDSFEVSAVRIGGNFGLGLGGDGILDVDGGSLTVTGAGLGSGIQLGFNNRDGKLNISNGAMVDIQAGGLLVGVENGNAADVSEVNVTGASTLNVTGSFYIGGNQNTNTDANTRGTVVIGNGTDSPVVNVTGGNTEVARGGIGRFTLNSGEFNQLTNNFVLAQTRNTGSNSNTDAIVTVNGGTLNVGNFVGGLNQDLNFNGGLSVFNHNGGDVNVERDVRMATANDTTSNATYNLDAGTGGLSIGRNLTVGEQRTGEFNFESGSFSIGGTIYVGGSTSGSATANANANGTINIGENGGTPTMNTNQFEVGRQRVGVVNQFGGDVNVNGANNLVISQFSNSTGTYNMMGGTLDVGDPAGANGHINFNQGTGTFNQTGGDVTVNRNVQMANTNSAAVATYDISGGTLDVTGGPSDLIRIGIAGTGIFIAREDAQVDAGTIRVGESNNVGNRLDIREFATVNTGHLDVADGGAAVRGTVNQTGGTLNVTALTTYEVGAGGLATVNHSGGTANVTGDLNIGTDGTAGDSYTLSETGLLNFGDTAAVTQVLGPTPSTMTVGVDGDFNFEGGTLANVTDIHVDPSNSPFTVGDNDSSDIARLVVGVDGGLDPNNAATTRAYTTISDGGGTNPDGSPLGTPIDFVLNDDGTLAVDVFGFGSHGINGEQGGSLAINPLDPTLDSDILHVTGDATLNGLLEVDLNGFEPNPFAWYDVLLASGEIDASGLDVSGVNLFRVEDNPFGPGQILQVAVPEPASIAIWSLLGLALAGFGYRRLRK